MAVLGAAARLSWAKQELDREFDTQPEGDTESPHNALEEIGICQSILSMEMPKTTLGCFALLKVAEQILLSQVEDPELTLAQGPLLEIVQNVARALNVGKTSDIPLSTPRL